MIKPVIKEMPASYSTNNVTFMENGQPISGFGYQSKKTKKIHIVRCPKCDRENYAIAVNTGICAWCTYDPNK